MNYLSETIITLLTSTSPNLQLVMLFVLSYGEGLPVIGSVLPGGTIAILAGTLSAEGIFSPITASVLIALGSFTGDMTGFLLGKRFKHTHFVQKIINQEKHQKMWDLFDRHIALISIFGKLIPVVRSTPSIFAGARGQKTRKYILYSFIGSILWGIIGIYAGNTLAVYFGEKALLFIVFILIITITIFIIRFLYKKILKKFSKSRTY